MALRAGFFNALRVNDVYDRRYNADDYSNALAAFIKDGVRRSGADDFAVTANGLTLSVKIGWAMVGGKWVNLDADAIIGTITPPVGDYSRVDAVVLRVDKNEAERAPSLFIRQGVATSAPVAPSKVTDAGIHELILAFVDVAPSASTVTLTDTRGDANLCGWITTPVGYDDYFESLDNQFDIWFAEKRDTLASVTLFKQYIWRTVLTETASTVIFDIPQYDSTGVDILNVYVNGLLEIAGVDYTVSGSAITFSTGGGGTGTKIAGTEIVVICYKSIDGTGLGSVAEEITELQNKVAGLVKDTETNYICNGVNDNVKISEIVAAFNASAPQDSQLKINVFGTFGATAAYRGAGTSASPYTWFSVGADDGKRVIIDFSNCQKIYVAMSGATANTVFEGNNITINGLNIVAACYETGCSIDVFTGTKNIHANGCYFKVVTTSTATLAYSGTFNDCEAYISSADNSAYCFYGKSTHNPIIVNGGKYRAYTASTDAAYYSTIVMIASWETNAVVYVNGLNAPTVPITAFYQKTCFHVSGGLLYANGVCTALTNENKGGTYNVYGVASLSKP